MTTDTPHSSPDETPASISERLGRIIGYNFQNQKLTDFIDRNGHEYQISSLERQNLTPEIRTRIAARVRQIETMFTEPVARAAEIAQTRILRERPGMNGVNLELVIPRAIEIVGEETAERLDVRADIGYTSRRKR